MAGEKAVSIVVCDSCGAKWWPQVWAAQGHCPSCHNPKGSEKRVSAQELADAAAD